MLSEGIRRHSRGEDAVIGIVETQGRKGVAELASKLETVQRRKIEYKGTTFEEMDVDAILARKPRVALIDELAHTNVESSRNDKRYQDVMELLDVQIGSFDDECAAYREHAADSTPNHGSSGAGNCP